MAFLILALAPLFFGALALVLGQDANWDFRNYHWYNAYALVNGRYLFDLLPSQTPFFYNPTLDVPFYLLASHVSARVAFFLLGAVQGLNFILLFMLAHACLIVPNPRHKVLVCALLAALGMLGGGGMAQIGTTFYDNVTSLGLFIAALLVLRYQKILLEGSWKKAAGLAVGCGFPSGLMMGLKLPSVIFCVGLCFALLLVAGPLKRRALICFSFGVGVLLGLAVALGPWAWFLAANFGSPLFPYFNDYFKSPLAPLVSARDMKFIPGTLSDKLLYPFVFSKDPLRVGEIPWRDWRMPILYALLPLSVALRLFFGRSTASQDMIAEPYAARYLLWVATLSYIVWVTMFAIYRYALPLEMIAPLLIVFAVGMLPVRVLTRALLATFVLAVVAASVQPGNWTRLKAWRDHAVEVQYPPLGDTSKLMILMAGYDPYSHVVSAFPTEIPFVRIQSNFASPEENKGINGLIRARLEAHKGPFKLLVPDWQKNLGQKALAVYDLTLLPQTCQKVVDYLVDNPLILCDVARKTSP
ncbi:MAG: hypothetical protein HGA90_00950 [Alphaproteobacteria bacterium]|nr:hypothetical protein [Alphaproteobacteria bacterium]